jgi:predicted TIM-barrel fold metal-dependent hydrolase
MKGTPGVKSIDAFWLIDGQTFPKPYARHNASLHGTPVSSTFAQGKRYAIGSQTLMDVDARLKDMDRFGIDVQVNFPTLFLDPLTEDLDFEAALMRSYNSWIATQSSLRADRLRWAAVLPMRSPAAAAAEVRRAKEMGAACVASYGTAGELGLHHPSFDSVWAECERMQMPVGIHAGSSNPGLRYFADSVFASQIVGFTIPVFLGFYSFIGGGILDRFPNLKVAFLEVGADWLPWMIQRMDHYDVVDKAFGWDNLPRRRPSEYLKSGNIYLTTEGEEELLPEILKWLGEDQIILAGDLPHAEDRENAVSEISERTDISEAVKRKILYENSKRFFGF